MPSDDYSADTSTTGILLLDTVTSGTIDSQSDVDWLKFHADQGQHYIFQQTDRDAWGATLTGFQVYDARGTALGGSAWQPFEPARSGDYFVALSAYSPGKYNVKLATLNDDYSANDSSPGQIAPGATVTGRIQYSGDSDRFQFRAEVGKIYQFALDAKGINGAYNSSMLITDQSGNSVKMPAPAVVDGKLIASFFPEATAQYALNIAYLYQTEDYSLSESVRVDDFGGTRATAAVLDIGASLSGSIEVPGDVDMFKVTLLAGTTYQLELTQQGSALYSYQRLELDGPDGNPVDFAGLSGRRAYSYTPTVTGTYTLAVSDTQESSAYTISAKLAPDDYGATLATAGALKVDGAALAGSLDAGGGDRDWFTVSLDAGQTYWARLMYPAGSLGGLGGVVLKVMDPGGKVLGTNEGMNSNDASGYIVPIVAAGSGLYTIEVSGPKWGGGAAYRVQVQHGVVDDVGNDPAHAAALALDVAAAGRLELPSDIDAYKLHVEAGNVYRLEVHGTGADASWKNSVTLSGKGDNNATVWFEQLPNSYSRQDVLYKASSTGDIYLLVGQQNFNGTQTGSYRLSASSYGQDDQPPGGADVPLMVGGQAQGRIDYPGDRDSFLVHLEAGRSYAFELGGALSGMGALDATTAVLSLYPKSSLPLPSVSTLPGGEARLIGVPSVTGDYQLSVTGDARHLGSYTVKAWQTSGDLSPPMLVSPRDLSVNSLVAKLALQFSESVMLGSGAITLKDSSGAVFTPHGANSYQFTAGGKQLVIDANGYLAPGETYTLTLPQGSVRDLAGNPLSPLTISIHTPSASSQGSAGNDLLVGHLDGARIDGGAGIDTVYYARSWYQFDVARNHDEITVHAAADPRSDVLTGIERLQFQDGALALDIAGHAGQAYRLYQAAFDRAPDDAGLGYWIAAMDHGATLQSLAHSFGASAEFQALYGATLSDRQFVDQLYHNVLHRDGDAAGIAYWTGVLAQQVSRDLVLASFSESDENQAVLIGRIEHGIHYTPYG